MKRITLLVDLDDVMEDLMSAWVKALNRLYGLHVKKEDIVDWDMQVSFPSLTNEEIFGVTIVDSFWEGVLPKPGAKETLEWALNHGFEVYVCTSSDVRMMKVKYEKIIQRYFPFIDQAHIIITRNKQLINGDILIDDCVKNLIGGSYEKILMTCPHNKYYETNADNGIIRVNDWRDIKEELLKYKMRRRIDYESHQEKR